MRIVQKLVFIFLSLFPSPFLFASELPFTDVSLNDPYYADLKQMYEGGVIAVTPDRLFRPN